jgi:hypothetical protein
VTGSVNQKQRNSGHPFPPIIPRLTIAQSQAEQLAQKVFDLQVIVEDESVVVRLLDFEQYSEAYACWQYAAVAPGFMLSPIQFDKYIADVEISLKTPVTTLFEYEFVLRTVSWNINIL